LGPLGIEGRSAGPDQHHYGRGNVGGDEQDIPNFEIRTRNASGLRASDFWIAWRVLAEEIGMKTPTTEIRKPKSRMAKITSRTTNGNLEERQARSRAGAFTYHTDNSERMTKPGSMPAQKGKIER